MQSVISINETIEQELASDWYGTRLVPPVYYSFRISRLYLHYRARRETPLTRVHPDARPGRFQAELWKYDTAEFFVARADGSRYVEFNLCPNGAWWCCAFSAPRVADGTMPPPEGVRTMGLVREDGWCCEAALPLSYLEVLGIDPACCRLAAAACFLKSGEPDGYQYLTSARKADSPPDFHRPDLWEIALSGSSVASRNAPPSS